jgi:hypothetical protein
MKMSIKVCLGKITEADMAEIIATHKNYDQFHEVKNEALQDNY